MFEEKINVNQVFELRAKTTIYFGVGAIDKISDIAKEFKEIRKINKVMFVTGKNSYKVSGAWDHVKSALEKNQIEYTIYDKVGPNPTVDMLDEAVEIGKKFSPEAIIGIGGGSPIDTAKGVAILLKYPEKNARQLYSYEFTPVITLPIIAINLTHGTGTELNRFAVATIPETEQKAAIAYDCIYPLYTIDDPKLMTKLSIDQTKYVSIDALNHASEAATTILASPYSMLLAKESIRLVIKYLPIAIKEPENLTARYYLLYASIIAGISFDNGMLHITHALEHPLSSVKPEISHGLGLAVLLPAVLKATYSYTPEIYAELYKPIIPELEGKPEEAELIGKKIEEWLFNIGITEKLPDLGFVENDIEKLVKLTEAPILDMCLSLSSAITPEVKKKVINQIYKESFCKLS